MTSSLSRLASASSGPGAPSFINNAGIQGVIAFIVSLVLIFVAIRLFSKSDKGDVKGATNTGIVVFIGCVILAIASAAAWVGIGSGVVKTLFN